MKSSLLFLLVSTFFIKAQVGINTATPLGVFHIDGGKDNVATPTVAQQTNDFIVTSTGATGIGTTSVDTSAKLQINASDKGLLIPRVALKNSNDGTVVQSPAKGLLVYNTTNDVNIEEGFYVNYGTPTSPIWRTFEKYDKDVWRFDNFFDVTATNPVDRLCTPGTTINNINLGMAVTVQIPPFTQAKLVTSYSVPMGTTAQVANFSGYYGIRFMKNTTELVAGSRKYSIIPSTAAGSRMASVSATIGETINNNTASSISVTYSLNGYVEPIGVENGTVRFNMWSSADPNFNWGRSYMTVQMYNISIL